MQNAHNTAAQTAADALKNTTVSISSGLHYNNNSYLITVEHYSEWNQVKPIEAVTSQGIINQFDELFTTFGMPETMKAGNATYYVSDKFKDYRDHNKSPMVWQRHS